MEATTKRFRKREAILTCLQSTTAHPSAEWVYEQLKPEIPDLSLGTVYRNLRLMVEDKEIRQIITDYGPDRYDRNMIPHEHLHCDGCGKLVDITFGGLKELLENKGEIAVNDYQLNIRGLCPACNTKQKKIRVQ
jgi:Fe2+ or Zn2+ uptake regulation protein